MVTMLDLEQLADSEELFDGHYRLLYPLSTDGATADIWLAVDTNTVEYELSDSNEEVDEEQGLKVAIKVYRPQNALDIEGIQRFRNEFKVVFNCQHSNLLHPVHFAIFKETPYLVLPYCKNGSTELLTGQVQKDDDIWKFIYDVASGLNYLHTNNPPIVHQDIKPANILIDDNRNYAITDFGISISRSHHAYDAEENSGTLAYMAPERFSDGAIPMPESDIWALGATLYELVTGAVPFGERGGCDQTDEKPSLNFPKNTCSKKIQRLICACLSKTPQNRPTARQLTEYATSKNYSERKNISKGYVCGVTSALALCVLCFIYSIASSDNSLTIQGAVPVEKPVAQNIVENKVRSNLSQDEERKAAVVLYDRLDEMPQFNGGDKGLCKYLSQALKLKSIREENKFFSVSIVINRDGTINDNIDIKTTNPDIEKNVLSAFKNMPKWIPGIRDGLPIPVQIRFSFLLKDNFYFKTSYSSDIYKLEIKD